MTISKTTTATVLSKGNFALVIGAFCALFFAIPAISLAYSGFCPTQDTYSLTIDQPTIHDLIFSDSCVSSNTCILILKNSEGANIDLKYSWETPDFNIQTWHPNEAHTVIFSVDQGSEVGYWSWEGTENHNDYSLAPVICWPNEAPAISFTGNSSMDPVDIGAVSANIFTSEFPVVAIVVGVSLGLFLLTWSVNRFRNDKTKGI